MCSVAQICQQLELSQPQQPLSLSDPRPRPIPGLLRMAGVSERRRAPASRHRTSCGTSAQSFSAPAPLRSWTSSDFSGLCWKTHAQTPPGAGGGQNFLDRLCVSSSSDISGRQPGPAQGFFTFKAGVNPRQHHQLFNFFCFFFFYRSRPVK